MSKDKPTPEDDFAAFLAANRDIVPLKSTPKVRPQPKRPSPYRTSRQPSFEEDTPPLFVDRDEPPFLDSDAVISHKHISVSNKILRKLSKGQYNIEAMLDLHGMTVAVAEREVDAFIKHCLQADKQVILLIHGKGAQRQMPILKNKLYQWLRHIDAVLAFCSAAPSQGSRGALVVLLKRKREEKPVER